MPATGDSWRDSLLTETCCRALAVLATTVALDVLTGPLSQFGALCITDVFTRTALPFPIEINPVGAGETTFTGSGPCAAIRSSLLLLGLTG